MNSVISAAMIEARNSGWTFSGSWTALSTIEGRTGGVVVLAEGVGLRLPQDEPGQAMPEVERTYTAMSGWLSSSWTAVLARQVKDRFRARGRCAPVEGKNIGYGLRRAPPIPFYIQHTGDPGHAAVDHPKVCWGATSPVA